MSKESGKGSGFALQERHGKPLVSILCLGGGLNLNGEAFNESSRVQKQWRLTFIRTIQDSHLIERKIRAITMLDFNSSLVNKF